jgi:hypothetical protein
MDNREHQGSRTLVSLSRAGHSSFKADLEPPLSRYLPASELRTPRLGRCSLDATPRAKTPAALAGQELYFSEGFVCLKNSSIFEESRHRVRRAQFHRNAFADHWNSLISKDALNVIVEYASDRTGVIRFQRRVAQIHDA